MLPVVGYLSSVLTDGENGVLWWALALGGNGTMIGASANMVTVGMAEKAGHKISFGAYARTCFAPMVVSIVICAIWLLFM